MFHTTSQKLNSTSEHVETMDWCCSITLYKLLGINTARQRPCSENIMFGETHLATFLLLLLLLESMTVYWAASNREMMCRSNVKLNFLSGWFWAGSKKNSDEPGWAEENLQTGAEQIKSRETCETNCRPAWTQIPHKYIKHSNDVFFKKNKEQILHNGYWILKYTGNVSSTVACFFVVVS